MASKWAVRPLGDLVENHDALRVPVKRADRRPGPFPYYGASGVVDHVDRYIFDGQFLLVAEDGENLRTRKTPVAFLARGKFWVNNHAHILRGNSEGDTRYLMYYLAGADVSGFLTGSTMPKLTQGALHRIPVVAPPLPEQRRIAAVLGALDDKIELNRKMNRTLEEMAQAIFKSWFIDFDGVPDSEMVDSELGRIPKGWEVVRLAEASHSLNSKRVPVSKLERADRQGHFPYYGASGVVDFVDSYIFDGTYLLVSEDGENLRTRKTPIAFIATGKFWVNNHAHVLLGRLGVSVEHLCLLFSHLDLHPFLTGAVQPKLSRRNLDRIPIVLPCRDSLARFNTGVVPLFERVRANIAYNGTLATLRDTLLPKLISGEIRVPAAEAAIEAAP